MASCVSMMNGIVATDDYGSTVRRETNGAGGKVWYKSYSHLVEAAKKEAENELLDEAETQAKIRAIPAGGVVVIEIVGMTLQSAKPEHHIYVLRTQDGKELARSKGDPHDIPSGKVISGTTYWTAFDAMSVMDSIPKEPLKFYLINTLLDKRSEFTIYPNQSGGM